MNRVAVFLLLLAIHLPVFAYGTCSGKDELPVVDYGPRQYDVDVSYTSVAGGSTKFTYTLTTNLAAGANVLAGAGFE